MPPHRLVGNLYEIVTYNGSGSPQLLELLDTALEGRHQATFLALLGQEHKQCADRWSLLQEKSQRRGWYVRGQPALRTSLGGESAGVLIASPTKGYNTTDMCWAPAEDPDLVGRVCAHFASS